MFKISDYIGVKEAAEYLGVPASTLRKWNKKKLRVYRNPVNKYRLYKKTDLEKLLKCISNPKRSLK